MPVRTYTAPSYGHPAAKADGERSKWQILAGILITAGLIVTAIRYLPCPVYFIPPRGNQLRRGRKPAANPKIGATPRGCPDFNSRSALGPPLFPYLTCTSTGKTILLP